MIYPDLFKSRYPRLSGKDWIKAIHPDDLQAFIEIGLSHALYGHLGGVARARTANRDKRGRFIKSKED